ncbi:unnamed protein product, partial [Ectocarpus sp. 4 AP-2014]
QSWVDVPGRSCGKAPQGGEARKPRRKGKRRLPRRYHGVPVCRDLGAGRKRLPRQQEEAHHPSPHPAGHPQRRGTEQAAGGRHHRRGRRPPQYPRGFAAQKGRGQARDRRKEVMS